MTRLVDLAIDKIGGLEQEAAKITQKLDVLTAQFSDAASIVIEDN